MGQHANQRWTEAFALLLAFKRREGHCRVPRITSREAFDLANGSLFNVIGIAFIVWLLSANVD